jgi:hypothetical protein
MQQKLEAIIKHDGDAKYIIARVQGKKEVKTVLVSLPLEYHSQIAREYQRSLDRKDEMEVQGGGILSIDKKAKKVRTYGKSGSFGKPDARVVESILNYALPDYKVKAEVTDFVLG